MTHPYYDIVNYDGDFQTFFDKYSFAKIFKDVFELYEDKNTAIKIVKFIAYGFSLDSTKIVVGSDRRKELSAIFYDLEIDKTIYKDVVLLEERVIKESCIAWCEFQDEAQLEYLFTLQQNYIQQQSASISPLRKADGINIDYDQKQKCVEHMRDLKLWVKEAQSELMQNNPKMKHVYKELNIGYAGKSKSRGIESVLREHENNVA